MKRRDFLRYATLVSGCFGLSVGVEQSIWRVQASISPQSKRLIVILLRGGVDGLNVLVPYTETDYYEARPSIGLPPPKEPNGVLPLNDQFGLHPVLSPLLPLWKNKTLAFIPASGSHDPTRSHFEAQDYMENGTPGNKKTKTGWLNRLLLQLDQEKPVQALNIGNTTPRIFFGSGSNLIASLPQSDTARLALPVEEFNGYNIFDLLYQGEDSLGQAYQQAQTSQKIFSSYLIKKTKADQDSPFVDGFIKDVRRLAQIMTQDTTVRIAFLSLGGWDTHIGQGSAEGKLADLLKPLGDGLITLVQGLGDVYDDTVIVVMSEFGRTVQENGGGGTDHGHGNVMWLMGGSLKGGQIYGDWQGLSGSMLYQGRDVPVLTDFRSVLKTILKEHLQLKSPQIQSVFPDYKTYQHLDFI